MNPSALMTSFIMKVGRGAKLAKPLEEEEAYQAMKFMLEGSCSDFQTGALWAALRVKGESASEMSGFTRALKELAPPILPKIPVLLDLGDPYDGKDKTLNLGPVTALILASCGASTVLHGDLEVPTKRAVGAGAVLKELGVSLFWEPHEIEKILAELGFAYLHASFLMPRLESMKRMRQEYGLRSSINVVEKMWNLCGAETVAVGIYHAPYFESTVEALKRLGVKQGMVVQGPEGSTELMLSRPTRTMRLVKGGTEEIHLDPKEYGFSYLQNHEVPEHSPAEVHAAATLEILKGKKDLFRDAAVWNSGVKLFWTGKAASIKEGIAKAQEALDSGKAFETLNALMKISQKKKNAPRPSA